MAEARRPLSVLVSWESYEGFERYCAEHGITLTALIEVVGLLLGSPDYQPSPLAEKLIDDARRIDQDRRRRPRRNGG